MSHFRLIVVVALWIMVRGILPITAQEATPKTTQVAMPELTEIYTTSDNRVSLRYPVDWDIQVYENPETIINVNIATNASALNKNVAGTGRFGPFRPGEALVQVLMIDICKLNAPNVKPDMTAAEILYNTYVYFPQPNIVYGEIQPVMIKDNLAARLHIASEGFGEGIMIQTKLEPCVIATFTVTTGVGELPRWEPTLLALIEATSYVPSIAATPEPTAVPLGKTYTNEDRSISFNYPSNWALEIYKPAHVTVYMSAKIGTSVSALERKPAGADSFVSDEAAMGIGLSDICKVSTPNLRPEMSAAELLQNGYVSFPQTGLTYGDIESMPIAGKPAARTLILARGRGEGWVMNVKYSDCVIGFIAFATAPGELEKWLPTALAITESITYSG